MLRGLYTIYAVIIVIAVTSYNHSGTGQSARGWSSSRSSSGSSGWFSGGHK
ncbi:hypothetical protein [Leeia aquatica]|uniref:Uncharacterized protein n=1 Tax=Leeia aquatica TaxID=2725557 RepID=A0A847SAZ6_9NEIS|nr:hypothetical protein [Leeia aquatica]NLR76087.1 hypothetical protein [Leeia aquatica]